MDAETAGESPLSALRLACGVAVAVASVLLAATPAAVAIMTIVSPGSVEHLAAQALPAAVERVLTVFSSVAAGRVPAAVVLVLAAAALRSATARGRRRRVPV